MGESFPSNPHPVANCRQFSLSPYVPSAFLTAAPSLTLGPVSPSVSLWLSPLKGVTGTSATLHLTQQSVLIFTDRSYWDFFCPVQEPWAGNPGVDLGPYRPQGGLLQLRYPS